MATPRSASPSCRSSCSAPCPRKPRSLRRGDISRALSAALYPRRCVTSSFCDARARADSCVRGARGARGSRELGPVGSRAAPRGRGRRAGREHRGVRAVLAQRAPQGERAGGGGGGARAVALALPENDHLSLARVLRSTPSCTNAACGTTISTRCAGVSTSRRARATTTSSTSRPRSLSCARRPEWGAARRARRRPSAARPLSPTSCASR